MQASENVTSDALSLSVLFGGKVPSSLIVCHLLDPEIPHRVWPMQGTATFSQQN